MNGKMAVQIRPREPPSILVETRGLETRETLGSDLARTPQREREGRPGVNRSTGDSGRNTQVPLAAETAGSRPALGTNFSYKPTPLTVERA